MATLQTNPMPNKADERFGRPDTGWRLRLYIIIFEADTRAGHIFDLTLLTMIMISVTVVMLDSVESISTRWGDLLTVLEWFFTAVFTVEYILRLLCVRQPKQYARSLLGVIDLLSILPTYLALFFPAMHTLIDMRVLRMLRIFRILKLGAYVSEFGELGYAIRATRRKITVFLSFVLIVVVIIGILAAIAIPLALFLGKTGVDWAITTMTTVGFGDITPKTDLGRALASVMMLIGWGTLAVPTGIVSAEFAARRLHPEVTTRTCHDCLSEGHLPDAKFCRDCGARLPPYQIDTSEH